MMMTRRMIIGTTTTIVMMMGACVLRNPPKQVDNGMGLILEAQGLEGAVNVLTYSEVISQVGKQLP